MKTRGLRLRGAVLAFTMAVLAFSATATGVRMSWGVKLQGGWNAVYLPVSPDLPPEEFFADWPVDSVSAYDQAAFLRTKQFTITEADSTQGAVASAMTIWYRGRPGLSSLVSVTGNMIYFMNVTNRSGYATTVYGEPEAMRISWHDTVGVATPVNYIGCTTDGADARLTGDSYFLGLDTGWTKRWKIQGAGNADRPNLVDIAKSPAVPNGNVVAVDAQKLSSWSGVFFVSPQYGVDLGTNGSMGVVSVRNDAGVVRTAKVQFRSGNYPNAFEQPALPKLLSFDPATDADWKSNLTEGVVRTLQPGETMTLRLAADRVNDILGEVGTEYGGVVEVTDVSSENCSHFRTAVPFSLKSDGNLNPKLRWPRGLWLCDLTLDRVAQVKSDGLLDGDAATEPLPAGGTMRLRLLVHVGVDGAVNLMSRARVNGRRISAPVLPTDTPVLPGSGTFGERAGFLWTVGKDSNVNPFRHAKHPDHDGLGSDFKTSAPSGDDPANYLNAVKPELFSVDNDLELVWPPSAAHDWNPEERLSGTCTWVLGGLRRECGIRMAGAFTMKRISKLELNELKEEFK